MSPDAEVAQALRQLAEMLLARAEAIEATEATQDDVSAVLRLRSQPGLESQANLAVG